jgi:hypothetical protein
MAKRINNGKKAREAQALIDEEAGARHSAEHPAHEVVAHMPAAAALLGPHPEDADGEERTGSPAADLEREQAGERGNDP